MRLLAQIRALFTLIVLASHSPLGFAIHQAAELPAPMGIVGISMFTARFTRVAAAQAFDPAKAAISRCPSRYLRRTTAEACEDSSLA
jgi:hypothetical protein